MLGEQSDPARDERGRGRGAGLLELDETLRCARLAVGSRRGTRDVHARRGQTERLRDPAAVGKIGDRALRIRRHDGQGMTPQLRNPRWKPGQDFHGSGRYRRPVRFHLAVSIAACPHVDRAFAGLGTCLRHRLDDVGKVFPQLLRAELLDVAGKTDAAVDGRHPAVQPDEGDPDVPLEFSLNCRLGFDDPRLELFDLLGRGILRVLRHDLVDDFLQVARSHPHGYDPGVERDPVHGRPACRGRVRGLLPCRGHDPRDERSMSERAGARAVGADRVAGADIGVVVPDVARFELAFELGVVGIDSGVDDPERHALAGRTAGVGVVRLDRGEPVLVAEFLVAGVVLAPLLLRLGIGGSIDRAHGRAGAAARERQGDNQDDGRRSRRSDRRPAGTAFRSRASGRVPHACHRFLAPSPFRRRPPGNPSTTRRPFAPKMTGRAPTPARARSPSGFMNIAESRTLFREACMRSCGDCVCFARLFGAFDANLSPRRPNRPLCPPTSAPVTPGVAESPRSMIVLMLGWR